MAHEAVRLVVIERQHANLGITRIYLQGIDSSEIINTATAGHLQRPPRAPGLKTRAREKCDWVNLRELSSRRRYEASGRPVPRRFPWRNRVPDGGDEDAAGGGDGQSVGYRRDVVGELGPAGRTDVVADHGLSDAEALRHVDALDLVEMLGEDSLAVLGVESVFAARTVAVNSDEVPHLAQLSLAVGHRNQRAPGTQHPRDLAKATWQIAHVVEHVVGNDEVKRRVLEAEVLDVGPLSSYAPSCRQGNHPVGLVGRGHLDAGVHQRRGKLAPARADLEHRARSKLADEIERHIMGLRPVRLRHSAMRPARPVSSAYSSSTYLGSSRLGTSANLPPSLSRACKPIHS